MTCTICCGNSNTIVRCLHCDLDACRKCVKRYIEEDTSINVSCMGCRKTWTREFMVDNLPLSWINGKFKKRQENLMMDSEKSLLPATQENVRSKLRERTLREELATLKKQRGDLLKQLAGTRNRIYEIEGSIWRVVRSSSIESSTATLVQGACPKSICKGFLGEDWKCKLCSTPVCAKCRMEKCEDEEHECKPEDVESAKFLKKDAKPCPNCTALCHKVDGCSQVFCINCKTAFNYTTLKVETNGIHAPDYYRWVRENGGVLQRAPGDNPCGRIMSLYNLRKLIKSVGTVEGVVEKNIYDIHRLASHINGIELAMYRVNVVQDNVDIRVQYMLNEIDETKWKRLLQQRNKAREKKQEIHAVLQTFVTVSNDLFDKAMTSNTYEGLCEVHDEFGQLRQYINDRMAKISTMFGGVSPSLNNEWMIINK